MKTIKFKSTKGGHFTVEMPENYRKIKLPYFKKWVQALESGKYRQGSGTLCTLDNKKLTYCCLGALSKVQGRLKKDADFGYMDDDVECLLSKSNPCFDVLDYHGHLPDGVLVKTFDESLGVTNATTMVGCNDDLSLSFKDIAKVVKTLYKA